MKRNFAFILFVLLGITNLLAQNDDSLVFVPMQVSFVHPIGSNGPEADNKVNAFSLNVIHGQQGGLNGLEIGGFTNFLKHNMFGIQVAGFGNSVFGEVQGMQMAGFFNLSGTLTSGFQSSGFCNLVKGNGHGLQMSGFANWVQGDFSGVQISGFINSVVGQTNAQKFNAIIADSSKLTPLISIAGFSNMAAKGIAGAQIAGFLNIASQSMDGLQIAGFANTAKGDFKGLQISGFINSAKKLDGHQIGFINISDTIVNGFAFGFLNLSKKGYRTLELKASPALYTNISFKTGSEKFYNIFSFGFKPVNGTMLWAYGYGLGSKRPLSAKTSLSFDLTAHQIQEKTWKHEALCLLNTLEMNVSTKISPSMELFVGPSFNVIVSAKRDENNDLIAGNVAPWTLTEEQIDNKMVQTFIGFQGGFRF